MLVLSHRPRDRRAFLEIAGLSGAALVPDRGASLLGDKAHSSVFDNAKVRRLVPEFQPRVTFAEGVARSIAWFDEEPARRVVSPVANANIERVLAAWGRAWEGLPAGGPR